MATNKKIDKLNDSTEEANSSLPATSEDAAPSIPNVDPQSQQLAGLGELTRSLMAAVLELNRQSTHNATLQDAITEVEAGIKAATRAMLSAIPANAVVPGVPTAERGGKCGPCECVSDACCCFEIVLAKARAAKPQIEPPDAGDIPGLINALEVQIYATVDGIGVLLPGLSTTMDLRASGLPGGPGPWVVIERVINRVCIKKGATVTKQVDVEVREHDEGVERPIAFKDELGEASGSITLDCCMATIYPSTPIDVNLIHGGEGGGMIQIAFYARRVCC